MFYNKDPRRVQPLVDHLIDSFQSLDFNAELSFDVVKILALFRALYEELGLKFNGWVNETLERCWPEVHGDHDDVRAYIAEILAFTDRIKYHPRPSLPTTEVFVKECRIVPLDFDIMGMRGSFHRKRITDLVEDFKVWREERVPGVRAFQSKYDRVGVTVCKWLFQSVHDFHAIGAFDYILPLMVS
jgi:proteasome activator subunit 4